MPGSEAKFFYYSDDVGNQQQTVLALPTGTYQVIMIGWDKEQLNTKPCCAVEVDVWTAFSSDPSSYKNWSPPQVLLTRAPWSLTAALTPGAHHVRLYLETEGVIDTIVSKKDNFTDFYDSDIGPISFLAADGSLLTDLTPRDPNISMNDAGVYVMTWDNRGAKAAPGTDMDRTAVSDTFGLAFSVDGLEWTVYSNELTIEGSFPQSCYTRYEGQPNAVECCTFGTSKLRHVVPIFITNDQIRLYFSSKIEASLMCPSGDRGCSTATAVSN